jgi:hypothetical protein
MHLVAAAPCPASRAEPVALQAVVRLLRRMAASIGLASTR